MGSMRGWSRRPCMPMLQSVGFFRDISPRRAFYDLRSFLGQQQKHKLVFLALSVGITSLVLVGFTLDSKFKTPYKRTIIYAESWPLDRTDAEIVAAQKIDAANRAKREAALEKRRAENRAAFKRLDDKLEAWGL